MNFYGIKIRIKVETKSFKINEIERLFLVAFDSLINETYFILFYYIFLIGTGTWYELNNSFEINLLIMDHALKYTNWVFREIL